MARLLFNLLSATLDADITDAATTVTFTGPLKEFGTTNIATIAGPDTLTLKVGYELMHVTAYTSGASTATVTRGVEGSTATAHNEGDVLRHVQTADDLPDLSSYAPLASPTFTGEPVAPSFQATGKTGATATPIRLAGGTAAGAPASGAHLKGEIVFDDAGVGYYCTVAGTPGTWVSFGGGGGGGGDVATDAIWDAAGDLVYGTGANTAARLGLGTALQVLRVNAGATAPEWAALSQAVTLISEQVLGSATTTVTFSSIPSTYRHLRLEVLTRTNRSGQNLDLIRLQFNSDTASNYWHQYNLSHGTTVTGNGADIGTNGYADLSWLPGDTAPAGSAGTVTVDIPGYKGTTFHKGFHVVGGLRYSTTDRRAIVGSGGWANTAAITQIDLLSLSQFVTGSVFSLYGLS